MSEDWKTVWEAAPGVKEDDLTRQLRWIANRSGEEQKLAGAVVVWQFTLGTLNELVRAYNEIKPGMDQRDRQIQVKKLIVGIVHELGDAFTELTKMLNNRGWLTTEIKSKKKDFETKRDGLNPKTIKLIRNSAAFHISELVSDPANVISTYTSIQEMDVMSLSGVLVAAQVFGNAVATEMTRHGV